MSVLGMTDVADIIMGDSVANGVSGVIFTFYHPAPLAWARIHLAGRAWLDDDILWIPDDEAPETAEMFEDEYYKVVYTHDKSKFTKVEIEGQPQVDREEANTPDESRRTINLHGKIRRRRMRRRKR